MCGPYTSLFTNSQSPTSSVGIMLPDGMRNASTKNVRMKRKMRSAPAMDFTFSHRVAGRGRFAFALPSAAATVELFAGGDERFLVDATDARRERGRERRTVESNYAAAPGRVSSGHGGARPGGRTPEGRALVE